jgi:hypothetical protein
LAQILSVDPKFIVPKQGNWFNPQDTPIAADKPDTWIAYSIDKGTPINIPMMVTVESTSTVASYTASVTWYISKVEIQLVGKRAEDLARTMSHWLNRQDVKDAFNAIDCELMADNGSYKVVTYYQDGLNTQLGFQVVLMVLNSDVIKSSQEPWTASDPVAFFKQGGN